MKIITDSPQWGVNYNIGYNFWIARKRDLVAGGIAWFSRWDDKEKDPHVCHTGVVIGPDSTVEAFTSGVGYGTIAAYRKDPTVCLFVRKPVRYTEELGRRIAASATCHFGEKYGFGLILASALAHSYLGWWLNRKLHDWPERKMANLLGSDHRVICSELTAIADDQPELVGGGFLTRPANTVIPQETFEDNYVFEPGAVELV